MLRAVRALALPLLLLLVVLVAVPFARTARADDLPTLSGTWSASAMSERWAIGEWGDACGPKPTPRGAGGGVVSITQSGSELLFSGGGYPRTSSCFETGGGISVTSHSGGARAWKTRCSTAANDPRRATIVTTVSATDSSISFDETGEYQFVLTGQNCTASVRRNRTYSLVKRLGDPDAPPATSSAPPPPAPSPTPAPTTTAPPPDPTPTVDAAKAAPTRGCDDPGDPARLEVRPSEKLVRPGESFNFTSVVSDRGGCRLALAPQWTLVGDAPGVTVSSAGQVTVAADAPEGTATVQAAISGKSVRATVQVVAADHFAEILAARNLNAKGESDTAATVTLATTGLGGESATGEGGAKKRRLIFVGIVASSVLGLGLVGLVMLRRQKPEEMEVEELVPAEPQMKVVKRKRLVAKPPAPSPQPPASMRCPKCGRPLEAGAVFCPDDGTRLVGAIPPLAEQAPTMKSITPTTKPWICPRCGERYPDGTTFCGRDGVGLVQVN